MTATLSPLPKFQFFADDGSPLSGGKLFSYSAGTTTPKATYTDESGTIPNTNPVILDSRGEASVWLGTGSYKLILKTANDQQLWSVDNIVGNPSQDAVNTFAAQLAANSGSSLVGFISTGGSAVARTVQSKLRDNITVKDFGAVGDGVTDDTAAFVAAANTTPYFKVPYGSYVVNLTTSNATNVLTALGSMQTDVPLTINLAAGVYTSASPINLGAQNGEKITLKGVNLVTTSITPATPVVVPTNISGNRYTYAITLPVTSTAGFNINDWVVVKTTGVDLTYTSYDETVNGARHNELDGFWKISNVGVGTITFVNTSRQSTDKFPGGGTVAAATANVTGGSITKIPTVLSFTSCSGFNVTGVFGNIENLAIVGNDLGTTTSGITIDTNSPSVNNQQCSLGAYNIGVAGFTGPGVNVEGSNASFSGSNIYSSGNGTHGFRAAINATASILNSIASGCGNTVGNGFFATSSATIVCSNSIANGVRNSGFISNRSSTMTAEDCVSINNGNYADEVAGGWADSEGKGFECESNSQMYCSDSVSIYQTSLGFYALDSSSMACARCVSNNAQHLHGFYALIGSTMSARNAVAMRNVSRGFYAYRSSNISAGETRSQSNAIDYVVQGIGSIDVIGYLEAAPYVATFNVPLNCGGANQIIDTNSFDVGTKLILTRGANLTIASGVITVTNSYHIVDTEGGAATDDLDTINGGVDGEIIVIRTASTLRDIVVKNGTGNIVLAGGADITLTNLRDKITLMYDSVANEWTELAFSDNAV